MNNALPTHPTLRAALYPAALRAVRRGEFRCAPSRVESTARCVASYAATDLTLRGFTRLLPAGEVEAAVGGCVEEAA